MKILIMNALYTPFKFGGAEKSVQLLAEALQAAGNDVRVVSLTTGTSSSDEMVGPVRVHRIPIDNIYWPYDQVAQRSPVLRLIWHLRALYSRKTAKYLDAVLDGFHPDVAHLNVINGLSTSVIGALRKRAIPIAMTLRDYSLICSRSSMFKKGKSCSSRCAACIAITTPYRLATRHVDAVAANSNYVAATHSRVGYFKGVEQFVIFNILPTTVATSERSSDANILRFGFIGRIEPEKGLEILLQATGLLPETGWELLIAGAGKPEYVKGLKEHYDNPRIHWLGFADPASFYGSIDTVVVASVWAEPLPRTLIEAYTYGCSAICSDAGGTPEIAHLGRKWRVYRADDVSDLAAAMAAAIADRAEWKSGGFAEDCAHQFSSTSVVMSNLRLYRAAIDHGRAG